MIRALVPDAKIFKPTGARSDASKSNHAPSALRAGSGPTPPPQPHGASGPYAPMPVPAQFGNGAGDAGGFNPIWGVDHPLEHAPPPTMRPAGTGSFVPQTRLDDPTAPKGGGGGTTSLGASTTSSSKNSDTNNVPRIPVGGGRGGGGRGRGRGGRGRGGPTQPGAAHMTWSASKYVVGPGRVQLANQFMDDQLRQELLQRRIVSAAALLPEEMRQANMSSDVVDGFHSFWPLEDVGLAEENPSPSLGVTSLLFKVLSTVDGRPYCLRRINGRTFFPTAEHIRLGPAMVEKWAPVAAHPGLCAPRHVLVTSDLDAVPSLAIVHAFHGGATTLATAHGPSNPASEPQLWSYLVQLATALHAAHERGLAVGISSLDATKVLLTVMGRVRIGSIGVAELLAAVPSAGAPLNPATAASLLGPATPHALAADLEALGALMLGLMSATGPSSSGATPSLDRVSRSGLYSPELVQRVGSLLNPRSSGGISTISALVTALAPNMCAEMGAMGGGLDHLTRDLEQELENGRLARLLIKLGMVAFRGPTDTGLVTEVGDFYLSGLVRDLLFNQVNEDGTPSLDWGHVLECLAKLDAGLPEKVTLIPRDERSLVVASFGDMRCAIEGCYQTLLALSLQGHQPGGGDGGGGAAAGRGGRRSY